MEYLMIALGSAIGGVCRYLCSVNIAAYFPAYPYYATIIINIVGSFIVGAASGLITPEGGLNGNLTIRTFVIIGFCGGYTTFSSFSFELLALLRQGVFMQALYYVTASIFICLISTFIGYYLTL